MDSKVNEQEMMKWFDSHKDELLQGKGFIGGAKKQRYAPMPTGKKAEAWAKKLHYGDEYNKAKKVVDERHIGGYDQKIYEDGNCTCNCQGWIFKRSSIRECKHVREIVGEAKGIGIVPKKITHKQTVNEKIINIGQELDRMMKGLK